MKAAKFAILTFTWMHPSVQSIHLQIDNVVALSYLVKMGGTHNKVLSDISKLKLLWNYLLAKVITITAEYFSGTVMKEADFQARAVRDSSKWKLDSKVFQTICRKWDLPDIEHFASRIYQVPTYISWKLDPFSRRDAFQVIWICFPPFCTNRSSLEQSAKGESDFVANYSWLANTSYPLLLKLTVQIPLLLSKLRIFY